MHPLLRQQPDLLDRLATLLTLGVLLAIFLWATSRTGVLPLVIIVLLLRLVWRIIVGTVAGIQQSSDLRRALRQQ